MTNQVYKEIGSLLSKKTLQEAGKILKPNTQKHMGFSYISTIIRNKKNLANKSQNNLQWLPIKTKF